MKNTSITVIPDMHGSDNWKKVYDIKSDYYISLGDWFDSFTIPHDVQITNFIEFMTWLKEDPEHRFLCLGNHDLAYILSLKEGRDCSGHNAVYHDTIHALLLSCIKYFKIYVQIESLIFSHAGISKTWIENNSNNIDFNTINDTWPIYIKNLKFQEPDISKYKGYIDPAGDNKFQGPLWIRPRSLMKDGMYPFQVIGHTEINRNIKEPLFVKNGNCRYILCDTPEHNLIFTINTSHLYKYNYIKYNAFLINMY